MLIGTGSKNRIVTGGKRLLACRELGYQEIECRVRKPGELPPEKCLKLIYEDNKEPPDDLEISEILLKYKELLCLEDRDIIKDVMPTLAKKPGRFLSV